MEGEISGKGATDRGGIMAASCADLRIFPLESSPLFPGSMIALNIFEPWAVSLLTEAQAEIEAEAASASTAAAAAACLSPPPKRCTFGVHWVDRAGLHHGVQVEVLEHKFDNDQERGQIGRDMNGTLAPASAAATTTTTRLTSTSAAASVSTPISSSTFMSKSAAAAPPPPQPPQPVVVHRVRALAVRRFRVLFTWRSPDTNVPWARVDYIDDALPGSVQDVMCGSEWRCIPKLLAEARTYASTYAKRYRANSMWRAETAPAGGADPDVLLSLDASALSFWLAATLPRPRRPIARQNSGRNGDRNGGSDGAGRVPGGRSSASSNSALACSASSGSAPAATTQWSEDVPDVMFRMTSTPRRLRLALDIFRTLRPLRAATTVSAKVLENTPRTQRILARTGGLAPLPHPRTLQQVCEQAVCSDLLAAVSQQAVDVNGPAITAVLNCANERGLIDGAVLAALSEMYPSATRAVHLVGGEVSADDLAPLSARKMVALEELRLLSCYRLTDDAVAAALAGVAEENFRVLSFDRCKRLGDDALVACIPRFSALRHLSVAGTRVGPRTLSAAATHLKSLRELDVSSMHAFNDTVAKVALGPGAVYHPSHTSSSKRVGGGADTAGVCAGTGTTTERGAADACVGLAEFSATSTHLTNQGAAFLSAHRNLRLLNLSFCPRITDWSFLSALTRLRELDLSLNYTLEDDAVALLARTLPRLEVLNLSKTGISDASAGALGTLSQLESLNLNRTNVGDAGLIEALPRLKNLRALQLSYCPVSDLLASALASSGAPPLRVLRLTGCAFGTPGIATLAESPEVCARLRLLCLGHPSVTSACASHLGQLRALEQLQLWETSVSTDAAETIATLCGLVHDARMRCLAGTFLYLSAMRMRLAEQ